MNVKLATTHISMPEFPSEHKILFSSPESRMGRFRKCAV